MEYIWKDKIQISQIGSLWQKYKNGNCHKKLSSVVNLDMK